MTGTTTTIQPIYTTTPTNFVIDKNLLKSGGFLIGAIVLLVIAMILSFIAAATAGSNVPITVGLSITSGVFILVSLILVFIAYRYVAPTIKRYSI